jgi:subtilisin family serine protease
VVVTVVDDGIEYDHPDLKDNYDASASTDVDDHDDDPYPNEADPINKFVLCYRSFQISL